MKRIPQDAISCLKVCLIVSVLATAMGCYIKNPKYPQSWPTVGKSKEIESQIEGKYLCAGEIVESNTALWPKRSVTDFLIGGKNPPACEMFEIRRATPDTIEIRYFGYDADGKKQIFKRGEGYHVEDNWVVLKSTGAFVAENIVMAHDSITPRLTTNSENDLIIKSKNAMAGTIMIIIPAGTFGSDWGKFTRQE